MRTKHDRPHSPLTYSFWSRFDAVARFLPSHLIDHTAVSILSPAGSRGPGVVSALILKSYSSRLQTTPPLPLVTSFVDNVERSENLVIYINM